MLAPISHVTQLSAQQSAVKHTEREINPFLSENDVIKEIEMYYWISTSVAFVLPSSPNDKIKYLVARLRYLLTMNIKYCTIDQDFLPIQNLIDKLM